MKIMVYVSTALLLVTSYLWAADVQNNTEQQIQVARNLTSMPLAFTENQGQWDEQVLYRANAGGATMWFTDEQCLTFNLGAGWHLISWNVAYSGAVNEAIADFAACVEMVLGFDRGGLTYDPTLPEFSTLNSVDYYHGYWLRLNCPVSFDICGGIISPNDAIQVYSGWNLVSYWPEDVLPVEDGFASLLATDNLLYALGFDGGYQYFDPTGPPFLNTLTQLQYGYGYWVKVENDDMLEYPGYSGGPVASPREDNQRCLATSVGMVPTWRWINIYCTEPMLDSSPLNPGDVIRAYDPDGALCGEIAVASNGSFGMLPIYADDPTSYWDDEGAEPGDEIALTINGEGVLTDPPLIWNEDYDVIMVCNFTVSIGDADGDGIPDVMDNCPNDYNHGQEDSDADGIGNVCDNCPDDYNPEQEDADQNGIGDVCDVCQGFTGVFCDDFEDGVITEWQVLAGSCTWSEADGILSTSTSGPEQWCIQTVGDQTWDNYVLEAQVRGNSGVDKVLVFRVQDANNYYAVNLRSDYPTPGIDLITFDKMENGLYNADIVTADFPSENGVWYTLRIECLGNDFRVYVDDALALVYTDNDNPYYMGGIGLACWTGFHGECYISFDNVAVTETEPPHIHLEPTSLSFDANQNGTLPANQTFTISNVGGGTLDWYVDEQIPWLDLDVWQGTSNSQEITVSINSTSLAPGTYNEVMTVTSTNADNSDQYIAVEYKVFLVPVFLVHGWTSYPSVWWEMEGWLLGDGYISNAVTLERCGHEDEDDFEDDYHLMYKGNAGILADFIEETITSWPQNTQDHISGINLIGHSMGGLVARRYITTKPGDPWTPRQVNKLIMLGTPNNGSILAGNRGQINEWIHLCTGPAHDELHPDHMLIFNAMFDDNPATDYFAISGSGGADIVGAEIIIYPDCHEWLAKIAGGYPNDGIVTVSSAIGRRENGSARYGNNWNVDLCHGEYPHDYSVYQTFIRPILRGETPQGYDLSYGSGDGWKSGGNVVGRSFEEMFPQLCYVVEDSTPSGVDKADSFMVEANTSGWFYLLASDSNAAFSLTSPTSVVYDSNSTTIDSSVVFFSDSIAIRGFYIENAEAGMWQWTVHTENSITSPVEFVVVAVYDNSVLVNYSQNLDYPEVGDTLSLIVEVTDGGIGLPGLSIVATPVWNSDDTASVITFYDDGLNNDGSANDGIYGALITSFNNGVVTFNTVVSGNASVGEINRLFSFYAFAGSTSCCSQRGDVDHSGSGIDISDLVYLVDYMFTGGPEPPCIDEADVDGSGGIDISDLVYLVDYMFTGGPAPPSCQ